MCKRILCLVVSFAIMFSIAIPIVNANVNSSGEFPEEFVLYDFSNENSIYDSLVDADLSNISVAEAPLKNGSMAIKWTDQPKGNWLRLKNLPSVDMNSYNTMQISMYSASCSWDTVRVVCASDNDATVSRDYYSDNLVLEWEGEWKNINIRIGDNGNMSDSGVPLGWDNLTGLEFWYNVDDPAAPSEVYIDKITLKNIDYSYQWEEEQFLDSAPIVENFYDFAAKINERFPEHQHPRLAVTQDDIDYIKREKDNDEYLKKAIPKLLNACNRYAEITDTTDDTITTSTRAATLALGYALTEKQEYKDALWEKMKLLSTDCISWEPGSASSLSIGDTARYVGLTYDLMYKYWTEEERKIVRNAIVLYGLEPLRPTVLSGKGLALQEDNWNPVIFSGLAVASLAIADADGYEETANQILNRVPNFFQHCFKKYVPDGAGFEGTNYWHYTMLGYLPYEAALCHSIGEEDYERFTLLNEYGLDKTGYFMLNMHGDMLTAFNFYDGHEHMISSTGDFWLARYFNKPEFGAYQYETGNGEPWAVVLYRPDEGYKTWREKMDTDYHADGTTQVGAMRTSYVEKNGFYVAYKGGKNLSASHGKLDIGSFVLESMGQRFIKMLPSEDYGAPEMFGHLRYSYYSNRAEGGNTLVIDPGVDQSPEMNEGYSVDQSKNAYSKIIATKSSASASYAIIDMTDAYKESAESIKRGFGLIADKNAFLLQDEITLKKGAEVYSFMHTTADVEVSEDGKSAIMSLGGKKMKARLLSPKNGKLTVMDAVPLPTSPEAQNQNRDEYKKLTVTARIDGTDTIAVLFTPCVEDNVYEYTLENVIALDEWDAYTLEQMAAPKITGESSIYRAPTGVVQKIEYAVVGNIPENLKNNVAWSIEGAPEGVKINSKGVLTISENAGSGTFILSAKTIGKAIDTKEITILSKPEQWSDLFDRYYEDFEIYKDDETIVMKPNPNRSTIKYADPSGKGLAVGKEENGNTYAKATGLAYWGNAGVATFAITSSHNDGQPLYMPDAKVVTVSGRFMIENAKDDDQSLMWLENAGLRIAYTASKAAGKANIYDRVAGKKIAEVNTGEWFDLRVEFDHINSTYDLYLNDIKVITENAFTNDLYIGGTRGNGFYIGASVDDLAMYNGRCGEIFETITIIGDANIYRAPSGTTQKIVYKANKELPRNTEWGLENAPEGVTIDQNGVLRVDGSASAGSFEVQLKNSGVAVSSKTVTILSQPEQYADAPKSGRYFEDFTRYKDVVIQTANGLRGEIKLQSTDLVATTEENGNTYAKAYISDGASWSTSTKALKLVQSYNPGNVYLPDASNAVIEGKFMVEMPTGGARWPMMWHLATGINISYEYSEEDSFAKIVYTDDSLSAGMSGNDNATIVAQVMANEWFNLRIELDYEKYTYSVFVDDLCVIKDKALKTNARINKDLIIAASVDDLAIYSGTKDTLVVDEKTVIYKNGEPLDGVAGRLDFTSDGENNIFINKMLKSENISGEQTEIFAAVYSSDGCLKEIAHSKNLLVKDITRSILLKFNFEAKAGDYLKIFTWNADTLSPKE